MGIGSLIGGAAGLCLGGPAGAAVGSQLGGAIDGAGKSEKAGQAQAQPQGEAQAKSPTDNSIFDFNKDGQINVQDAMDFFQMVKGSESK
ncbi:MAG TPA: hypothetical protein P5556_01875 [Candidatus Gastranaerophilales bacterium]|nr:hypothetical protein [Candidatus Gastranaerophilales bacterium]